MFESDPTLDPVADLAAGVVTDLYRAVCGAQPRAVRAYHDDDALLLLLRFDPAEMVEVGADGVERLLEDAFAAMPGMIASALEARTGAHLTPGNLSVCAERGLAVFAFNSGEQAQDDEGTFSLDDELAGALPAPAALHLAR